jgi:hypothetical protein
MFSNDIQFSLILSPINMVIFFIICLSGFKRQIWPQDKCNYKKVITLIINQNKSVTSELWEYEQGTLT